MLGQAHDEWYGNNTAQQPQEVLEIDSSAGSHRRWRSPRHVTTMPLHDTFRCAVSPWPDSFRKPRRQFDDASSYQSGNCFRGLGFSSNLPISGWWITATFKPRSRKMNGIFCYRSGMMSGRVNTDVSMRDTEPRFGSISRVVETDSLLTLLLLVFGVLSLPNNIPVY